MAICANCKWGYLSPADSAQCSNLDLPVTDFVYGKRECIDLNYKGDCKAFKPEEGSIEHQEKETSYEYEAAKDLAIQIWKTHYKADAPEWEPCDNLLAVLTQIDNMVTGLTKEAPCPNT